MHTASQPLARNIALYPWFKFLQNLNFWQAVWFLYFQAQVGAAEAILLYVVYDIATTALEVPSGYFSDRLGRRMTLILSALFGLGGALCLYLGGGFMAFAAGQALLGAGMAFSSGTDSALLYESLEREGRAEETDAQELRAWRYNFTALALSAVTGGAMAWYAPALPFAATALAFAGLVWLSLRFTDVSTKDTPEGEELLRAGALRKAFREPVLLWLFVLSVVMYGYSHIPFVFGQPFIEQALGRLGLAAQAPLVSGAVSSLMMVLSVIASLYAMRLRLWAGLPGILLFAFFMQIFLAAVLASTESALAIAFLLLRMVPSSLSRPFILARIQPLLRDEMRATYLSLQSFCGRLFFAATLWLAAGQASDVGKMSHAEMSVILWAYVGFGALVLLGLAAFARRAKVEDRPHENADI